MKRKVLIWVVVLITFVALVSWAHGKQEMEKVNFQLNWYIVGDHAPYYVALKNGWFQEEGLDVNIILGKGSGYTVQAVDTGRADLGIADAPVPIAGRAKGAKVKIVGIIFDKHPDCMWFWKDSGITKPQDMAGKTVAVPASDGHKVMFPAFAKLIGIDPGSVTFVNIDPAAKVPALAAKKADIVFDLYTGKPYFEKVIPPDQLGHFIWADYGFDVYAHSIIAQDDVLQKKPEMVKKFLKAAYRGWDFTLKNPKEAIAILAEYHPIDQADLLANLMVVLEFFKTERYKNYGIGYIDPQKMKNTIDLVEKFQGLTLNFKPEEAYSSDFLPKPMYKYNY